MTKTKPSKRMGLSPKYSSQLNAEDGTWTVFVTRPAMSLLPPTNHEAQLTLTDDQYQRFLDWVEGKSGGMIQDVLPELTAPQREILLTGITPKEWQNMFGSEDD